MARDTGRDRIAVYRKTFDRSCDTTGKCGTVVLSDGVEKVYSVDENAIEKRLPRNVK